MGYGQRLRMRKSADARVLKAQLDLIAEVVHSARFMAPLWALCAAWLASEDGLFGHMPLHVTLLLPAAIAVATISASRIADIYRRDTASHASYERLRGWFARFVAMQVVTSTLWGVMPWLLWDTGSIVNHIFLALAVVVGSGVVRGQPRQSSGNVHGERGAAGAAGRFALCADRLAARHRHRRRDGSIYAPAFP